MKKTLKKFLHIAFSLTLILSNAFITNINASTVSDGDIITLTDPNFNKSNGYNTNIEKYMTIEVAEINENQSNIILSINRENGILAYTPYNRSTKTYGETVEFSNTSLNVERKVYSRTNLDVDHKAGTYKYTPDQNRTGNIYNGKFRYDGSNIAYTYGKGFAGIPKFVNVTAKFMSDGKEIKPAVTQKGIQSQSYIFLENYPIEGYSQTTVSGVKSGKVGKSDITVIYNYVEDYDAAKHDIVIDPASSGDTKIIGTGFPGDTIVFTDSSGEKIGEGVVDSNGDYDITLDRPLIGDEIITGQPITNGIKGNKENVVVYNREKHKVTIEQPVENDIIVKGKGIAGDLLILKDGNGINIGETTVNDDGSYTINVSRPLIGNEEIKVIPYTNDIEGMETKSTVLDKDAHKPTVNKPGSGETNVTGKGTPGDEIIITDGNGKEIGKGTVDSEGNFDVKTDRPLEPNEVITITPQTDGKAGTPTEETVLDKDAHKPTVNKPGSGETNVTGKGTPGDEIIITDGKGKEIGKGTVDSEGNFDVKTDRPLEPNEVITITPQTDGKAGTSTKETVFDKDAHKPTVDKPTTGDSNLTGKGTPGDEIIITDGNGKEIGKGTVDSEGNFDVKTDRPLEPNEVITITPQTDGKAGTSTKETVFDKDAHKPTVDKPTTGDSNLTGKGTPGDEIIITDGKGKEIGKGTVDSEGNFDVKTDRPLEPNEVITITPQTDGKAGTPTEETVLDKDAHKPTVNKPGSGETNVTGKGTPGDEIIITDGKGKEIGKGTVDSEGNFDVKTDRPLEPNEVITITPQTDGKAGTSTKETVFDKDAHKPTVDKPTTGDSNLTGKGTPGDEIIITDGNGKEIGKGTVDSEGNFDVKTDRPLEPNEVITITPQTDGKAGTSTKETVFDKDAHKPTVDKPTTGDSNLTGKGTPGDEIIITDGNGKEIGKGTVDSEGNFDVKTDRPLEPNEVITITPQTDGKAGTSTKETVFDKDAHKPTVDKPTTGDSNLTGKGTPGDEIIITDGKGKEIGKGTVDSEGNFDVKTDRPLEPNEVITITPQTDGKAGTPTEETVLDKDAHKPTVNKPGSGETNVTGKGTPGDEIIITDGNGKEIGKGTVDSEGNFDVKTDRPLEPNEVITITPQTDGKAGTPTSLKVFDKYSHKPDLNPMKDGDELVSGTGVAGDVVIIIDSKGNEIGKGRVNILGKFSIKLNRKLSGGEEISAIPYTDGMRGTMITKSVMHQSDSKNVLPPAGISNNYSFLLLGVLQIVFGIKIYLKRMGEKEL